MSTATLVLRNSKWPIFCVWVRPQYTHLWCDYTHRLHTFFWLLSPNADVFNGPGGGLTPVVDTDDPAGTLKSWI